MARNVYQLQKQGNLLTLRAYVADSEGVYRGICLLVDTGATYTVLPVRFLRTLGYDVSSAAPKVAIAAAGGILRTPLIAVIPNPIINATDQIPPSPPSKGGNRIQSPPFEGGFRGITICSN